MEIKSILIKDTTREERIHEPYINGEKELLEIHEEYRGNSGTVR